MSKNYRVTVGGKPILYPDSAPGMPDDIQRYLDRYNGILRQVHQHNAPFETLVKCCDGTVIPHLQYPELPPIKLNQLLIPSGGERHGVFACLLESPYAKDYDDVQYTHDAQWLLDCKDTVRFLMSEMSEDGTVSGYIISMWMYAIHQFQIAENCHLVILADQRVALRDLATPSPSSWDDYGSKSGLEGWKWLLDHVGSTLATPGALQITPWRVPYYAHCTHPDKLVFSANVSYGHYLDLLAESLGQQIFPDLTGQSGVLIAGQSAIETWELALYLPEHLSAEQITDSWPAYSDAGYYHDQYLAAKDIPPGRERDCNVHLRLSRENVIGCEPYWTGDDFADVDSQITQVTVYTTFVIDVAEEFVSEGHPNRGLLSELKENATISKHVCILERFMHMYAWFWEIEDSRYFYRVDSHPVIGLTSPNIDYFLIDVSPYSFSGIVVKLPTRPRYFFGQFVRPAAQFPNLCGEEEVIPPPEEQDPIEQPPQELNPCEGYCIWEWSHGSKTWSETEDNCEVRTTTTTYDPDGASDPCACEESQTTTTTTTTTPEPECVCEYPDFCGFANGPWCTRTGCVLDEFRNEHPNCTGTTTTTTTTTPDPDCSGYCVWWVGAKIEGGGFFPVYLCEADCFPPITWQPPWDNPDIDWDALPERPCQCPLPGPEEEECSFVTTECSLPRPGEPGSSDCTGECLFVSIAGMEGCGTTDIDPRWVFVSDDCTGIGPGTATCTCFAPSFPPSVGCFRLHVKCRNWSEPTPTTTPDPDDPCEQRCRWQTNQTTMEPGEWRWVEGYDPCPSYCPCAEPPVDPIDQCDIAYTDCGSGPVTTTTTQDPGSTTTTPQPPGPTGACCCYPECTENVTEVACDLLGCDWLGEDTTCAECIAEPPVGACCTPDAECFITAESECDMPNVWIGGGVSGCDSDPCGVIGICCIGETCIETIEDGCPGVWYEGYNCLDAACPGVTTTTTTDNPDGCCCNQVAPFVPPCHLETLEDCEARGAGWQFVTPCFDCGDCPALP